jgi:hypothetical protein
MEPFKLTVDARDKGAVAQEEEDSHGDVQGELLALAITGQLSRRQLRWPVAVHPSRARCVACEAPKPCKPFCTTMRPK